MRNSLRRLWDGLGANGLPKSYLCFVPMHVLFTVYCQMHTIFFNTMIQRATGGTDRVMIFNIVMYIVQPIAMIFAVLYVKKRSPVGSQRFGMSINSIAYLFIAIMGERVSNYIIPIAAALSAASGFYFTTYIMQLSAYTTDDCRDNALSFASIFTGIASLVTPLFSGFLVSYFDGFLGYRILFLVAFLLGVTSVYCSTRVGPVYIPEDKKKPAFMHTLKCFFTKKRMRCVLGCSVISGVYYGLLSFIVNALIYQLVSSEALVGFNSFLGGAATILSAWLYGKTIGANDRAKAEVFATTLIIVAIVLLYFKMGVVTLIVFNVTYSLMVSFLSNPVVSEYVTAVEKTEELSGFMAETHTVREFFLSTGRISGLVLAMVLPNVLASGKAYVLALFIVIAVQYLTAWLLHISSKTTD